MTTADTVSVLIPCKNAAPFLAETLESALGQTWRPLEVIVVDDGSADASRQIAERFAPHVTILTNDGVGVSAARNFSARVSKGAYLQFLDADDLLEPHALATRVEALQEHHADVAISDWRRLRVRRGGWQPGEVESGQLPGSGEPPDLSVFRGFWAPPAAILYRRAICERIGPWREDLPIIQDARFLFDAARLGARIVHVEGVGASYRQHDANSVSTRSPAAFWRDVLKNSRDVEHLWADEHRLDPRHRMALAGAYDTCARVGFAHDRGLFEDASTELERFPEHPLPRFLRAASWLTRTVGYRMARPMLLGIQRAGVGGRRSVSGEATPVDRTHSD